MMDTYSENTASAKIAPTLAIIKRAVEADGGLASLQLAARQLAESFYEDLHAHYTLFDENGNPADDSSGITPADILCSLHFYSMTDRLESAFLVMCLEYANYDAVPSELYLLTRDEETLSLFMDEFIRTLAMRFPTEICPNKSCDFYDEEGWPYCETD